VSFFSVAPIISEKIPEVYVQMTKQNIADRLARLVKICLALPEAQYEPVGDHASFSVRKKKFAYYLNSHHGDGIVSVCFKTERGQNEILLASDQTRFYSPAYLGPRGWVGLRLDVGKIDWPEVTDFVTESYRFTAPKTLVAKIAPATDN
jgi:predicted DNA-binding protein (MmcQ/YjbR family)